MKTLGKLIAGYRVLTGTTLSELSSEVGISTSALVSIERGNPVSGQNLAIVLKWILLK